MKIYKMFSLYCTISSLSFLLAQFPIKQVHSLSPDAGSHFGSDVSVFGNKIAISSPKEDHSGIFSGSVEMPICTQLPVVVTSEVSNSVLDIPVAVLPVSPTASKPPQFIAAVPVPSC